jgi:hypothetical protein
MPQRIVAAVQIQRSMVGQLSAGNPWPHLSDVCLGTMPHPMAVREVRVLRSCDTAANSGACCTANWPIPVEADRLSALQAGLATAHLRPAVV